MKRYWLPAIAVFAVSYFAIAVIVKSGGYHAASSLICSDCHTMHYSEESVVPPPGAQAGGPWDKLLLKPDINNLCLTCHDSDGGGSVPNLAPDVMTGASGNQAVNRAAGSFQAASGAPAIATAHNLGLSGITAPGSNPVYTTPAAGLTCIDCHDPHGNTNFRNLEPQPAKRAVTAVNVQAGGVDLTETAVTPTPTQYNMTNIIYRTDKFSRWCATCHNNFYATAYPPVWPDGNIGGSATGDTAGGAADQWKRHPASHITIGQANTNTHADSAYYLAGTSKVLAIDVSGNSPGTITDDIPFCGSCHKAHGSDTAKPNNLYYDNRATGSPALQDGASMNDSCQQCHNQ